jgi:hypothetical protein
VRIGTFAEVGLGTGDLSLDDPGVILLLDVDRRRPGGGRGERAPRVFDQLAEPVQSSRFEVVGEAENIRTLVLGIAASAGG